MMGQPEAGNLTAVARGLAKAAETRITQGKPLVFGTVYPFSMHTNLLRLLFNHAGIASPADVSIRVVPPPKMVSALAAGEVDGYCVGEPWNSAAARTDHGQILLLGTDLWEQAPEKVLGVNERFAEQSPKSHAALISALLQACQWLDQPDRIATLAHWLSQPDYLDCSSDLLLSAMLTPWRDGKPRWRKTFFRHHATYPFHTHGQWMLQQLVKQNAQCQTDITETELLNRAYRKTRWESVAASLDIAPPTSEPSCP